MKIAMLSEHADPSMTDDGVGHAHDGGRDAAAAELAFQMGREGHDVTIYARRDSAEPRGEVRSAPGVCVEYVPVGPDHPVGDGDLLPHIADFGEQLERRWVDDPPDVVHTHYWTGGLAALAGANELDLPVVSTFHTLGSVERRHDEDPGPPERVRLEQAVGRTADAVIATCAEDMIELARMGVPRDMITVVPTGVDVERFRPDGIDDPQPAERRTPRLVVTSRLAESKGVDTAIEALRLVPDAELVVAGGPVPAGTSEDPEIQRLRRCAEEAGVDDRVEFVGRLARPDVPRLLRSADLVVTLPRYESSGSVPLEAMACGVPVVASRVGGQTDTVVDRVTGLHVRPDRPTEVGRTIQALLAEPARLRAFGIAGTDRARSRYAWPRIAEETIAVYEHARTRRNGHAA